MRKWLSVILSLVLLCTMLPASADSQQEPGIYRLLVRQDDTEVNVGMAVLVDQSGTGLLTSAQCLPESGSLYVSGADGTYEVAGVSVAQDGSGLARLTLTRPSTLAPMSLTLRKPASWMTPDGSGAVTNLSSDVLGELPVVTAQLAPGLLPGTLLLADNGMLAGVVISAANEGFNRYVCLSGEALYQSLMDMTYVLTMDAESETVPAQEAASGVPTCSIDEDGMLVVDFTGLTLPEYVYMMSTNNQYFTYVKAQDTMRLAVAPGVIYHLWFGSSLTEENFDKPQVTIQVPQAEPLTDYGYTEIESFVGIHPTALSGGEGRLVEPQSVIAITELLDDQELCFYNAAAYQISEEVTVPASFVLTCPDGSTVVEGASYTYDPALTALDHWTAGFTGMLDQYLQYSKTWYGEYTISYYVQNKLAGFASFTLTESAEAQAEEPREEAASRKTVITLDENNSLTVDISGVRQEGESWYCLVAEEESLLYLSYPMANNDLTITLLPGRTYTVWVQQGNQLNVANASCTLVTAELPPFADYGFADAGSCVLLKNGDQTETVLQVTREQLASGTLYARVCSVYEVEGEIVVSGCSCLAVPGGQNFLDQSSYIFSQEYMALDSWDEDLTAFLERAARFTSDGKLQNGLYTYSYYIQGRLAAQVSFELVDELPMATDTDLPL